MPKIDSKLIKSLDQRESAGYMTNWAARLFTPAIERRLAPLGLRAAHLPVFFALSGGRTLSQKELAAAAAVEQPTMAATLNRMEAAGLIRRQVDPTDRRASRVSLTRKAEGLVGQVESATAEVNAIALADLTKKEAQGFFAALAKVIAALEAELS